MMFVLFYFPPFGVGGMASILAISFTRISKIALVSPGAGLIAFSYSTIIKNKIEIMSVGTIKHGTSSTKAEFLANQQNLTNAALREAAFPL